MRTYTLTTLSNGTRRINKHIDRGTAIKYGGQIVPSTHKDVRRAQKYFRARPYAGVSSYVVLS